MREKWLDSLEIITWQAATPYFIVVDGVVGGVPYPIIRVNSTSSIWIIQQATGSLYSVREDFTLETVEYTGTAEELLAGLEIPESITPSLHTTTIKQDIINNIKWKLQVN